MVHPIIKNLAKARAVVVSLEKSITTELASLPSKYGFGSLEEFLAAIRTASRGGKRTPVRKASKRRKRARITKETHARVKALVRAGKTGSAIAAALKISLPSVQNIKKALGLVKSSKRPAPKKKVSRPKPRRKTKAKAGRVATVESVAPSPKAVETAAAPSQEPSK